MTAWGFNAFSASPERASYGGAERSYGEINIFISPGHWQFVAMIQGIAAQRKLLGRSLWTVHTLQKIHIETCFKKKPTHKQKVVRWYGAVLFLATCTPSTAQRGFSLEQWKVHYNSVSGTQNQFHKMYKRISSVQNILARHLDIQITNMIPDRWLKAQTNLENQAVKFQRSKLSSSSLVNEINGRK